MVGTRYVSDERLEIWDSNKKFFTKLSKEIYL